MDWVEMEKILGIAIDFIAKISFPTWMKISLLSIAGGLIVAFLWPMIQIYRKIYTITLINRMAKPCYFTASMVQAGVDNIKYSPPTEIAANRILHYQVVPKRGGIFGMYAIHAEIKIDYKELVAIPIYNSGDIQHSRVFFIEELGVRESGSRENDTWTWSEGVNFAEQRD